MRRFGVIGDIHVEERFLETALDRLAAEGVDAVLAVGDIADGEGDLDRCIALLERHQVVAVTGNHDRWLLAGQMRNLPHVTPLHAFSAGARTYLSSLPPTRRLETAAGPLLLCHGLGDDDMAQLRPADEGYALESNLALHRLLRSDLAFVVGGHTHQRMVRRFGALTFINAGTLLHVHRPCFVVVDLDARTAQFHDLHVSGDVTVAERLLL